MRQLLRTRLRNMLAGAILITYCYLFLNYFGLSWSGTSLQTRELAKNIKATFWNARNKTVFGIGNEKNNDASPSETPDTYKHLLNWGFPLDGSLKAPKPAFVLGNLSGKADFIIGIPTVKRDRADYLMGTLRSLVDNRRVRTETFQIVIFIADVDENYVQPRSRQIFDEFKHEFDSGKMQVISPPKHFYPDWNIAITNTLGDSLDRVKWRSKENLDAVFIMMYIYQLSPKYYLMLEDDVLSDEGYDRTIVDNTKRLETSDWFFISYCGWCSIGKLFKTETIPSFASFVHMFWNKKPLDWLQADYTKTAYCYNGKGDLACTAEARRRQRAIEPYVFHHIGKYSSLKGKQQPILP